MPSSLGLCLEGGGPVPFHGSWRGTMLCGSEGAQPARCLFHDDDDGGNDDDDDDDDEDDEDEHEDEDEDEDRDDDNEEDDKQ